MQKTRYDDDLDSKEKEQIERLQRPWQRTFLKRFYAQLQKQKLRKRDVILLLNNVPNKDRLLPAGYALPKSTLSECTNFNPTRRDGEPKPPKTLSVDTLLAISLALNVSPNYLLGYEPCEVRKRERNNHPTGLEQEILKKLMDNEDLILDDKLKWKIRQLKKYKKDVSGGKLKRPFECVIKSL